MGATPLPVIDYYSNDSRENALLRYSLWLAEGKRCYICSTELPSVRDAEIDHVLPKTKKLTSSEFARRWTECAPASLPNLGVHHISNLRAACRPCNSAHRKGSRVPPDTFILLVLARAATIIEKAHREQRKLLKNSAMGESLVHLTTASTDDEYSVIWDEDLKQALLATMVEASARVGKNPQRRQLWTTQLMTEVVTSADVSRMLAALQIVSGVSADALAQEFVSEAAGEIQKKFEPQIRANYSDLRGPDVGYIDWAQTVFEVSIDRVSLADDDWRCEATVTVDTTVSAPVQVQSEDGSELEDQQSADCDIEADVYVEAEIGSGGFRIVALATSAEITISM